MNPVEKEKKKNFLMQTSQKKKRGANLSKKTKNLNLKSLVDTIHKLIVKKLKLNVNHPIKIRKNHNLLQV
jgi:hypothetical protein